MKRKRSRFTIGVILLIGGLGLTWFVDKQQQAYPTSTTTRDRRGDSHTYYPRSKRWEDGVWVIYTAGIVLIIVGAGVTALNLPLPEG